MDELIQIVDAADRPVGTATKKYARENGLHFRVVGVLLRDGAGRYLLQRRSAGKDIWPLCWDFSAGGHVNALEGYKAAARRELAEELSVHDIPLRFRDKFKIEELSHGHLAYRFVHLYVADLIDRPVSLKADEVAAVEWMTAAEIRRLLAEKGELATPNLHRIGSWDL